MASKKDRRGVGRMVRATRAVIESLERRTLMSIVWSGKVFLDANENGAWDSGEEGLAGYTINLLANGGDEGDPNDPEDNYYWSVTDSDVSGSGGNYSIDTDEDEGTPVWCGSITIELDGQYMTTPWAYTLPYDSAPYNFGVKPNSPPPPLPNPDPITEAKESGSNSENKPDCPKCENESSGPVRYGDGLIPSQMG